MNINRATLQSSLRELSRKFTLEGKRIWFTVPNSGSDLNRVTINFDDLGKLSFISRVFFEVTELDGEVVEGKTCYIRLPLTKNEDELKAQLDLFKKLIPGDLKTLEFRQEKHEENIARLEAMVPKVLGYLKRAGHPEAGWVDLVCRSNASGVVVGTISRNDSGLKVPKGITFQDFDEVMDLIARTGRWPSKSAMFK